MTWSNIKEQLNKNLKQKGIEEQVHESLVISLANSLMVEIWGIEIQQKARVVYFKNDILTIAVLANNIERTSHKSFGNILLVLAEKYQEILARG